MLHSTELAQLTHAEVASQVNNRSFIDGQDKSKVSKQRSRSSDYE